MKDVVVSNRLTELEQVIERGQTTFIEVGNALTEIRDKRLYKAEYKTFEQYCKERWHFKHNYAYKQMAAAKQVAALCTTVHKPRSEREARRLRAEAKAVLKGADTIGKC